MKPLLLALALCACGLHADTNPQLSNLDGALVATSSGSDVYALASASPTVRSSMVDLANFGGLMVAVTGTATVDVLWSSAADAATPASGITLFPGDHKLLEKKARYIGFRVTPGQGNSVWGSTPAKASVFYTLVGSGSGVIVSVPSHYADVTLSASTADASTYLSCTAGAADVSIWNTSALTINYILEGTSSAAPIIGAPLASGATINIPVSPAYQWLHYTATGTATGYLQLHY